MPPGRRSEPPRSRRRACPETCARLAAGCYRAGRVPELPAAIRELTEQSDMLLPSVKTAIDQHLLPAFDGH